MKNSWIEISPEVSAALQAGRPVVALESTIISHGLPWPENLEMARQTERLIREQGVVPATIAILAGRPVVGLNDGQIEQLAKQRDVAKVSRRDIGLIMATGRFGATTVASTMLLAQVAGIRVFVTGGIGGVHRHAQQTMDVSADLQELARTPVAVVCAGAKSILDIGLTLEYLETQGVPVVGLDTDDFPAFYTRSSGFPVDARLTIQQAATAMHAHWELGLTNGLVVANPIPADQALEESYINGIIEEALRAADDQGIKGKAITPFLLARIKELSGGRSLAANLALVYHNAIQGARLAAAYAAEGVRSG
ncbi:MAG: pseudouridine-5-phosphate glycosidase [Spirochaetes bacterium GWD1_61_31]|nr:MAG: pseudouridine-5-phosphate glycosidase [Spirochaetes bacterium GWB1_60_80]OHD34189.1 MAG: pseudouridine-5-phosphate glycosidase [Spirochaetes bacterium GWC1_61_12]OHD40116.1 MAG: pseudouridine-5-phosphate glycosidase [Spirochaetes bacterium GWD1_61_31]OHD45836.1 MAG: pseudouridine-5-phosphate glycosidase [Spirochaetes bacterium GWE1_60_18]OHD58379.1 MAG: pseudouridine-5-phosphate glycosidase [Spirochaetes bacterium GWF1_60_12]HAW85356.1 pseudouridine-5-phosphate glycosidase [Spirochaeta